MGIPLVVLNQYYAPDVASTGQVAAELCRALAQSGFDIYVITAEPSYTSSSPKAPYFEVQDGVHIYRVPLWGPKGREQLLVRLSGYIQFLWKGWRTARCLTRKVLPKYIITFHNPPMVPIIGAYLARKLHSHFIYILFDIHPDVLLATGWKLPRIVIWVWEQLNKQIFRQADVIVVLGNGMKQTLLNKGVPPSKIKVISLWGRPELLPLPRDQAVRDELGIGEEELVLLYAGNMGIMHPLELLLDVARAVNELPVWFVFLGDGVKRQQLMARAKKDNLRKVIFLPFQPEERFVRFVSTADACFVVLEPGLERLAFPSRTFTFLSAGKPVITLMSPQAEAAQLVREHGCGWNATDSEQLVELIRQIVCDREQLTIKGLKAYEIYRKRFSRDKVTAAYVQLLNCLNKKANWEATG
ncbi:MAG: glycosyltransferase family 4 protein [Anaerolineae bacterium]|nr:glycosyltransferase family 4 protein [Anaerolineae bacterium]